MKRLIYIIIAIVFIISCTNGQNKANKKGVTDKTFIIPDSLYSFFPDISADKKKNKIILEVTNAEETGLPYFKEEFAITYLTKGFRCNDTAYFSRKKKSFFKHSVNRFNSLDTNYFIIGSERDLLKEYSILELKEKYLNIKDNNLMIDFHEIFNNNPDYYSTSTVCGLPEDYEILILKSGNEYVLPEKYKNPWEILPEKLKHGYISGVALKESEGVMIYWVVAW